MGPWWALWLILTLSQILESQISAMSQGFPQMTSFQSDQFQGEWFVLGLADNTFRREHRALLNFFTTLFELKEKSQFQVTNSMTRGKHCNTWSYTLIPATKPGQFTRDNRGSGPGADRENIQVIETDYTTFALVLSLRQTSSQNITRVSLLGRNWRLSHKTIDKFICLTRTQNLTKDNFLFPDLSGNGLHAVGDGVWRTWTMVAPPLTFTSPIATLQAGTADLQGMCVGSYSPRQSEPNACSQSLA